MKKIIYILLISIICTSSIQAKKLLIDVNAASFINQDNMIIWEFYYSFSENSLVYLNNNNQYLGELFFHISIYSNLGLETEKKWIVSHQMKDTISNNDIKLLGQKEFLLNPGQYKVNIYVQDVNDSSSHAKNSVNLVLSDFHEHSLRLSDIELAQNIVEQSKAKLQWNKAFKKSNLYVIPNPSAYYLGNKQPLQTYFEIYNVKTFNPDSLIIDYSFSDVYGNIIKHIKTEKIKELNSNKIIKTNTIPLIDLPSGNYYININSYFYKNNIKDSIFKSKKLYIINPEKEAVNKPKFSENQDFELSEFSTLSPKQTDIEVDKIKYIANGLELDQFQTLTSTKAKQRALYRFWKKRDTKPETKFNENLFKFRKLINYTERFFSYSLRKGWDTDRGRVLLKYGMPSERKQHPYQGEQRPYEEWFYGDIQGGVYFYFVDITGYGNFILVHSTAIDEITFDDWYNYYVLKKDSNPLDNQGNIQQ